MAETYILDTEAHRETLVDADALARAAGGEAGDFAGRRAVKVDLSAGAVKLVLPLPRNDFTDLNMFVLALAGEAGVTCHPRLSITLASKTAGLPHPDSFNSGRPEDIASDGAWREALFPFENFLIYGTPPGVVKVDRAEITIDGDGPVWLAGVDGVRRRRARGSRMTDAGLWAALDQTRPDLAGVAEAQRRGDDEGARAALLKYLATRTAPRHFFALDREARAAVDLAEAESIRRHVVLGYDVGTPIDWRANPNGYLEWMHAFNRTGFFNVLLSAWRESGEGKYLESLDEYFSTWIADNPEPVNHNGGGDPAWETLSVAVRIYASWLKCFFSTLHEDAIADATRIAMLKSFHGHAEHLMRYKGHANNWLIVESRVLVMLGIVFPEFNRAQAWVGEGLARLEAELGRQIFPDGADWELAPGYHMMAIEGFLDVYELARLNGRALPPLFEQRLPKAFEYIAGMSRPDGTLPSVNDSSGYRDRSGRAFLARGARLFDRPEWLVSPEGPYAGKSRGFPDAGFHVLAGGAGAKGRWLLFDGGPFGASHQHEDALGIELFAFGTPFLVDPGIASYLKDEWTAFYRHTRAHNTVLVNSAGQHRRAKTRRHHADSARDKVRVAHGPVFDWCEATYTDGYENQPDGLAHRRRVLFVRDEYYLVLDEVTGEGAETMEVLYHFAPMRVEVEARTHRARSHRLRGGNLEIVPVDPRQGIKASMVCGAHDPVQGWLAEKQLDVPAPVVNYRVAGAAPLRFAAVLAPFEKGVHAGLSVSRLPKMPPQVLGLKLSWDDGRSDRVLVRYDAKTRLPASASPLDADALIERMDAQKKRVACAWVKDQSMTVEG